MEAYCTALLNQEKSLEELQRHLRTTEELFRESVKRKNHQLDLLQGEVRRLKSSVAGRDEHANSQVQAALSSQAAEVRQLREQLASRDAELDAQARETSQLRHELQEERRLRRSEAQRAEAAASARGKLIERDSEVEDLRDELTRAQSAAARLEQASMEAEATLRARDAELQALRSRKDVEGRLDSASSELDARELQLLRAKADETEVALQREQEALARAESLAKELEGERNSVVEQQEGLERELEGAVESSRLADRQLQAELEHAEVLKARVEELELQLRLAAIATPPAQSTAQPVDTPAAVVDGGRVQAQPVSPQAVRSLVVSGATVVGSSLTAEAQFSGAPSGSCSYTWYRGDVQLPATGPSYTPTAEDVGQEISVRVSLEGAGRPVGATASGPIAISQDMHRSLRRSLDSGKFTLDSCLENDKERSLLFTQGKLKLKDKAGKTLVKDPFAAVRIELGADPLSFSLLMASKKGGGAIHLRAAQRLHRDLIYLAIQVFRDPNALSTLPIAPAATSLALAPLDLGLAPSERGPPSPASSMTSEQPSIAGDFRASEVSTAEPTGAQAASGGASRSRRTISFGRSKKSK